MGEVQAGAALVGQLLARYPTHHIVMTTMTTTGAARVRSLFAERVTHCYLPYDVPFAVRGFLDRAQPQLAVILETELWPNLLSACRRRQIPVLIASARISLRTANTYRRLAGLFRHALAGVTVAAQTQDDAERFKALGAADVQVNGNIKFDIEIPEQVRRAGADLRAQFASRLVWVAGSTHGGEEAAAIAAHRRLLEQRRDALLILVPRHPQRFDEVRGLLGKSGLQFVTRSSGAAVTREVTILLVDTMGELLHFYAAADVAFVGGTLVPIGGHNLLEPAALGVPTLCGPYVSNAQDVADRLINAGAVMQVHSGTELSVALLKLHANEELRARTGRSALQAIGENRGALSRLMQLIGARVPK
jgi:3-deoxy-D-manno-octulosonic-acid transferase